MIRNINLKGDDGHWAQSSLHKHNVSDGSACGMLKSKEVLERGPISKAFGSMKAREALSSMLYTPGLHSNKLGNSSLARSKIHKGSFNKA